MVKRSLLALLLLTACGDGAELPDLPDLSSATRSPTATVASPEADPVTSPATSSASSRPEATRSPSAEPGPGRSPSAAPSALPSWSPSGPAAQGDVDGDGEADTVAYDGDVAVVTLSGGGVLRADTDSGVETDEPPATAGVEDLDRDGRAEVFVRVGRGASTGFLAVLSYDGSTLGLLTTGGAPLVLAFGGSVGQGDGFTCTEDGGLVVRSAVRQPDDTYELAQVVYAVEGRRAAQVDRSDRVGVAEDDDAVAAAYVLDCRSVAGPD